jgi:hypothetical protein
MTKLLTTTIILTAIGVSAEVWEKPPYLPDENHLPPLIREAQEEELTPARRRILRNKKFERLRRGQEEAEKKKRPEIPNNKENSL